MTEGEQPGLLHALAAVPDPRNPRGLRYPLAGLLAVAVCAVPTGASSVTAIADWLHDVDDIASRGTAYLTISLPAADAHPADLQAWIRREWFIEALHHVRDMTFREDSHQARTGNGPAGVATLRNTTIGFHRARGATNIARATRRANRRPHELITTVISGNPRTQ